MTNNGPETGRLGPRPLPLHLVNALMAWGGAAGAAGAWTVGGLVAHRSVQNRFSELRAKANGMNQLELVARIASRAQGRLAQHLRGVELYRHHPFRRTDTAHKTIWQQGQARLLEYGQHEAEEGHKPALLLVPSLINPAYILDLMPGRSLIADLVEQGFRPILLDWGDVSAEGDHMTLDDFVCDRLLSALDYLSSAESGPVPMLGYCMGGLMALAATALHGEYVSRLALLATPWDFHADQSHPGAKLAPFMMQQFAMLGGHKMVPLDWMQSFFASLDPTQDDIKFRRFAELDMNSRDAEFFVAMEDWANGGYDLPRAVAERCLNDWYVGNLTAKGGWKMCGKLIEPQNITQPLLIAAPGGDRLVPQASAIALKDHAPNAVFFEPPSGHVGMVVGRRAKANLWRPLGKWLASGEISATMAAS